MQYTAKLPHNSVLILQPEGLRYRFQEDHVFKDIRYSQITGVKVKRNLIKYYFVFLLGPFMLLSQFYMMYSEGFNEINIFNAIVWFILMLMNALMKNIHLVNVKKGPLTAEVYGTHDAKEAKAIKRAIEIHR